MHEKDAKGILSHTNGMNVYRGCTHGCIYCDSRSLCYNMQHDFEDIEVKRNAPELLDAALSRKREKCMVGTGAMTDPYLHAEETLLLTRRCLEVIERRGFGLAIQTKSNRCLRDLDLFKSIHRKAKCVVEMTLTTFGESLCRLVEPYVCTTRERSETLMTLRENGIPTVVWLSPFLPFLNDTEENLRGLLDYCVRAEVKGILCFGIGMTLRDGNREHYYKMLDRHFPGLKERYIKTYGDSYEVRSANHAPLMALLQKTCAANNILCGTDEVFSYLRTLEPRSEQLRLF
ncbi:MAG: radical SAM protein [Clostridiaceae bacterium]|nr:radical SAM protein [Eubacteriales bacterium]